MLAGLCGADRCGVVSGDGEGEEWKNAAKASRQDQSGGANVKGGGVGLGQGMDVQGAWERADVDTKNQTAWFGHSDKNAESAWFGRAERGGDQEEAGGSDRYGRLADKREIELEEEEERRERKAMLRIKALVLLEEVCVPTRYAHNCNNNTRLSVHVSLESRGEYPSTPRTCLE
jgi:hypothetical protein